MKRLGIDLGGTSIKLGVVQAGHVLAQDTCGTPVREGYEAVVRRIAEAAKPLLWAHPDIRQVGVGTPGLVDTGAGLVCTSNNFGWENVPLRDDLQRAMGLPVQIANDAHCATLGEALYGAGKGYGRVAMLTVGTGVGGGFVQGGRLEAGRYASMAYILGHMVLRQDGRQCNCGRRGCLEAYAGAGALGGKARQLFGPETTVQQVFEAARAGDGIAQSIVGEFTEALAEGVVNVANILRPEVIVIGGGVSASCDMFLPAVNQRLAEGVYGFAYAPVTAVEATLGNAAGLAGAASLFNPEERKGGNV